jgi:thioredoxin reductase (NADPH)
MRKPTLVAVDDDPQVLAAVRRDLRDRYARDYRIVAADSGPSALAAVEQLHRRGDEVALFLVDERMPQMTGTAFLVAARPHFPEAKKVLLTAYSDTDAAIRSINEVGLDHYLLKPWHPREDQLYPVLDDLLDDWWAGRQPPFDGIRIVGARWSPASHEVKDFLARNQVPYRFLDVERDPEARSLLEARGEAAPLLPLLFLPGGETLARPDSRMLARHVGLHIEADMPFYDLMIIGAGPAGLAAAVYGSSEGLRVAVVERQATGGQAGTSSRIENYLGFPNGISGADLARRASAQARRLGAEILTAAEATSVRVEEPARVVTLADGTELSCHALLVATGMRVRELDVDSCRLLTGAGVFYGATLAEAATYRDERVVIVGGANSAGQAAMMFARFAERVTVLIRSASIAGGMSRYLVDQIEATPTIEVLTNRTVADVRGTDHLEDVVVRDVVTGDITTRKATGLFIFIGALPHSDFVRDVVATNPAGFILTGPDIAAAGSRPAGAKGAEARPARWPVDRDPYLLETSVPGIFAAGDVRHGAIRRVASAVGQGATSVTFVHQYLETM